MVKESFQREIVESIFKILNILWEIREERKEKGQSAQDIPYISEIITKNSSPTSKEFAHALLDVIIKWVDFENQPEVSKQVLDFVMKYDERLKGGSEKITSEREEEDFCDL